MSYVIIITLLVLWAARNGKLSDLEDGINSKFEGSSKDEKIERDPGPGAAPF